MIETKDTGSCFNCGACAQVCYFKARKIDENVQLAVDREKCHGCGLCVDVCPTDSVKMVGRS